MTERSGPRGPKGPTRSSAGRGKRPGADSRGAGSRGKGEQDSRTRSGRPGGSSRGSRPGGSGDGRGRDDRPRGGSRDGRGRDDRDGRGGSRGGSRDDRPRGGSRDDRDGRGGSRDDRPRGGSRDDRDGRGGRGGSRGGSRDDRPRGGSRDGRSRDDRGGRGGERSRVGKFNDAPPAEAGSKSWGKLARQGAARIKHDPWDDREEFNKPEPEDDNYERTPEEQAKYDVRMEKRAAGERNRERLRSEAQAAIERSGTQGPPKTRPPTAVRDRALLVPRKLPDAKRHLVELLGESHGKRAWRDLNLAAEHLDAGRTAAAVPMINRLYRQASAVVEVAETYGLAMYATRKWFDAIEVLEDVRVRTGQPDQNPVLADAHRAVGNWADVAALWEEVRDLSPASEIVVEARIVAAGALADQGEIGSAVRLLAKGWKRPKRPLEHHLRRAYALADLYERAGETPRAKELFAWVAHHEPDFVDAKHRSQ